MAAAKKLTRSPVAPAPLGAAQVPAAERIEVGSRYAYDELRKALTGLLAERRRDLGRMPPALGAGWEAAMVAELDTLDGLAKGKTKSQQAPSPTGAQLRHAIAQAKDRKREFLGAVEAADLHGTAPRLRPTRHNPLALADQLDAMVAFATSNAAALAPWNLDAAWTKSTADLATSLRATQALHQDASGALSQSERELQAEKGLIYLELKRLSRAARAFPPERRDKYVLARWLPRLVHRRRSAPAPRTTAAA